MSESLERKRAALAATLSRRRTEGEASGLKARGRRDEWPLSFSQERLYVVDRLGNAAAYNIQVALRLDGILDASALSAAFSAMVQRHDMLRVRIIDRGEQLVQCACAPDEVHLSPERLHADASLESQAARMASEELRVPFDLRRGAPFRVRLLQWAEGVHVLLLTVHHIVADGWSMSVLMHELGALYSASVHGKTCSLAELPLTYGDFAAWQRDTLRGDVLDSELAHWASVLAGAPTVLELPVDRSRVAGAVLDGAVHRVMVPSALMTALKGIAARQGATPFMAVCAALAILLSRWGRQADVLLGTPVAGRTDARLERLVGCFINLVVLRIRCDPHASFVQLLGQVKQTALQAYAHQTLPFERLVRQAVRERDAARHPLVQVNVAWQSMPRSRLEMAGLSVDRLRLPTVGAQTDVSLVVEERSDGGLLAQFEYATALFDAATIERLAGQFVHLLGQAAADPEQPTWRLGHVPPEQLEYLSAWNSARPADVETGTLHHCFARQASSQPDAPAVIEGDHILSYGQLDDLSNRCAAALRSRGVAAGAMVGLCIDRGSDLVVGLLGILKSGAVCLPLDPALPAERLAFMVKDSDACAIIVGRTGDVPVWARDVRTHAVADLSATPQDLAIQPQDERSAALCIYTSGSTGTPKGVAVGHRGLVNYARTLARTAGLARGDRVLLLSSIGFDVAASEIFGALLSGSALVLRRETLLVPQQFSRMLQACGITFIAPALAYWSEWIEAVCAGEAAWPPQLKTVILGGERLPASLLERWQSLPCARAAMLLYAYGPTEASVACTLAVLRDLAPGAAVHIGRPIPGVQVHVLDEFLQPAGPGVVGEIFIGGAGVALGYVARPELTAERFVADPFRGGVAKMYRTGDLGRIRGDGNLEFHGRVDDQVKIRGFRVEPAEIEQALLEHEAVAACAVAVRDESGRSQLVAFLVARSDEARPDAASLRAHLGKRVPRYLVPASFNWLEALPRTASGKLDRQALASRPVASAEAGIGEPMGEVAATLARLWSEFLGLQAVGPNDDFFELGGDSLLALRVAARVGETLGVEVGVSDLMQRPTVAAMAECVQALQLLRSSSDAGAVTQDRESAFL